MKSLQPHYFQNEFTNLECYSYSNLHRSGKLLINAGLHGDEWHVIEPLHNFLQENYQSLPSFVFIPQMSPSAVLAQTRINQNSHDLNRCFGKNVDPEANLIEEVVRSFGPFDLVTSFHEDIEYGQTYFYDVGNPFFNASVMDWQIALSFLGFKMLSGIDNPDDPELGYVFRNGYNQEKLARSNGQFEHWVVLTHWVKRSFSIEIPSFLNQKEKQTLIDQYFKHLILKAFA